MAAIRPLGLGVISTFQEGNERFLESPTNGGMSTLSVLRRLRMRTSSSPTGSADSSCTASSIRNGERPRSKLAFPEALASITSSTSTPPCSAHLDHADGGLSHLQRVPICNFGTSSCTGILGVPRLPRVVWAAGRRSDCVRAGPDPAGHRPSFLAAAGTMDGGASALRCERRGSRVRRCRGRRRAGRPRPRRRPCTRKTGPGAPGGWRSRHAPSPAR